MLAADAKLDAADAFSLLAWYGAESAGSLTLLAPDARPQVVEPLRSSADDVLEARIRRFRLIVTLIYFLVKGNRFPLTKLLVKEKMRTINKTSRQLFLLKSNQDLL